VDFKTIAQNMYPYWILGALVISAVIIAGKKHLLRVEAKPVLKWIIFLGVVTSWRLLLTKLVGYSGVHTSTQGVAMIPPIASLTVFWEDACHGLPILLLRDFIGTRKWWAKIINWSALLLVMTAFGLGHLYQSVWIALLLCFYIPYSVRCGRQYGFGTVMICHTLYDLVTLIFVKYFMGI
jgi:hypothetical protein